MSVTESTSRPGCPERADVVVDCRHDRDLVFRHLVERWASETPDRVFAEFPDAGVTWTWRETLTGMTNAANAFAALGVARGSRVAIMCLNTPEFVQSLLGVTALGAVAVPVNPAHRGAILEHALTTGEPVAIVCSPDAAARLVELDVPTSLRTAIVVGAIDPSARGALGRLVDVIDWSEWMARAHPPAPPAEVHFWDPYAIVLTSGTTGPSKGSINCYGQLAATIEYTLMRWVEHDDVYQLDLPLFHVSGLITLMAGLQAGIRIVVFPRPSIERYWERISRHGITHTTLLPAIVTYLWNQPPSPSDRDHKLRRVTAGRYWFNHTEWTQRFGIPHVSISFNMTEVSSPLVSVLDPPTNIGQGRPRPGVELRLADAHDSAVPPGDVGELLIRTELPWQMSLGYVKRDDATVSAWRNGWFHTGDLFRVDADGNYHLVDRLKDSIRRRGENISSFEVEREIHNHPAVAECAVTGISAEHGDQEVVAWIVRKPSSDLHGADLIEFLRPRLTAFMLPRYVVTVDELPHTASGRIRKVDLRALELPADVYDRQRSTP